MNDTYLANMVAARDGIHPAHAANRVAMAVRIADRCVQLSDPWGMTAVEVFNHLDPTRSAAWDSCHFDGGRPSPSTIRLAADMLGA